ncbi:MAG: LPXTG cell wall anchor domain-containing protein [Winogradskyella sp.]|nr:LPXTG cell wall anchor domain-containing protein [Winogradskyella sp.]NNK22130.1 LPXTG cell wall anchor domain-containing protein [Winogradskyella sp.]
MIAILLLGIGSVIFFKKRKDQKEKNAKKSIS